MSKNIFSALSEDELVFFWNGEDNTDNDSSDSSRPLLSDDLAQDDAQ